MLGSLNLNDSEMKNLDLLLKKLEKKNGTKVYKSKNCSSSDCKRWDCGISCYCANSLL